MQVEQGLFPHKEDQLLHCALERRWAAMTHKAKKEVVTYFHECLEEQTREAVAVWFDDFRIQV